MKFITSEIGSAKDNAKSPIHNWYKFTAGFSHNFVDEIIKQDNLKAIDSMIFDPFAGCGTTLVSSQKKGVPAVGNEGQKFMYNVIQAKLNWKIFSTKFNENLKFIGNYVEKNLNQDISELETHELLRGLYKENNLKKIYLIKLAISNICNRKYRLFFNLALSQILHKVSIHPIAIPYISRSKKLKNSLDAWEFFKTTSKKMFEDIQNLDDFEINSKIFLHDSRKKNSKIEDDSCSTCITSPPYLNNLDYGEVSKVHTHFFELTEDWGDITEKVRKKLVTGATTHYREADFDIDKYRESEFYINNKNIADQIIKKTLLIKEVSKKRGGKKSFDILTLLYFQDMYKVLKEIRRVVRSTGKTYLILGDSAPYGVHIKTTNMLAKIAKNTGFTSYRIQKIRTRGTKWKSLTYRHSIELAENVLILK